ncbi:ABC transporter permease [Brevibacillus massiliensis]|jgi:osmoprotectant transport system permease protein|uniref:ABC transporter permease n=1 Tax=Brevibacillus massiliensis TaxID=1118054 RepID=UPI0002EF6848|nr:ABC transporter permease [Brevibacillus massiliensis]
MSELIAFVQERYSDIFTVIWQHLYISAIAVIAGFIVSVPLGIVLTRTKKVSQFVIGIVNVIQTIPSLALLGFMIPLIGIGTFPAIVALFLYSILPMLQNTYTGIREVDPAMKEAARGMGMTDLQILLKVEVPLAISVIMGGFRTATIYTISWATLASLIGGGGLGYLVFTGLTINNESMLLIGAISAALLAALADILTRKIQSICTPRGLRK